ncbi:MAG TPA: hypothetical protein DHW71_03440 [Gammaproteobacteria bacterium]|nr:hypothetical protein [Gammaproteobacteria bacterium]HCK92012.1 hypothetical protein [Gammaproteobacteria bacterium]
MISISLTCCSGSVGVPPTWPAEPPVPASVPEPVPEPALLPPLPFEAFEFVLEFTGTLEPPQPATKRN